MVWRKEEKNRSRQYKKPQDLRSVCSQKLRGNIRTNMIHGAERWTPITNKHNLLLKTKPNLWLQRRQADSSLPSWKLFSYPFAECDHLQPSRASLPYSQRNLKLQKTVNWDITRAGNSTLDPGTYIQWVKTSGGRAEESWKKGISKMMNFCGSCLERKRIGGGERGDRISIHKATPVSWLFWTRTCHSALQLWTRKLTAWYVSNRSQNTLHMSCVHKYWF